jgi:hypothetical protein
LNVRATITATIVRNIKKPPDLGGTGTSSIF